MIKPHKTSSARRRVPLHFLPRPAADDAAAANASSCSADRSEPASGRRGSSRVPFAETDGARRGVLAASDPPEQRRAEYLATHAWIRGES